MNRSNQGRRLPAERGEGSPQTKEQFTALLHHLTVGLLRESFYALKQGAAAGVDGVTWREYETGLEDRIQDLHSRVHRGAYRAQPSRRVYIPKADGRQRPLGIAALEDKIVQQAVVAILNQIYEVDFLGFSYGFRPERSQHEALDALTVGITTKRVNWVLDADIRGFFDNLNHEWLMKFIQHRVADPRMLRLIQKWLQAGVSEDGSWSETKVGTPQGSRSLASAGQRVSALRSRPVGGSMAEEGGAWGGDHRPIRRRLRHGLRGPGGGRALPGGFGGAAA
jgi:retron-type reverse transcriptase